MSETNDYKYSLERFKDAQRTSYSEALTEIRNGKKETHWLLFVFPQLRGLGYSYASEFYGLDGLDEAKDFLADPYLADNLIKISNELLNLSESNICRIMPHPDNLKLCSSITLFYHAAEDERKEVFKAILDKYYSGRTCRRTEKLLEGE